METLSCKKCNKIFDIYENYNFIDLITCPHCKHKYPVIHDIDYAISSTGSGSFYKYEGESIIEINFENAPMDDLESVWQTHKSLNANEISPHKLLAVVKGYHDILRLRIQRFLIIDHQNSLLKENEIYDIKTNPPEKKYNLKKFFGLLIKAIPDRSIEIDIFLNDHQSFFKELIWLRNKEEHISVTAWPVPSHIHIDTKKYPKDRSDKTLNYFYLKEINNQVIDILRFLLDIDPIAKDEWEYQEIENLRIKSNH